MRLSGSGKYFLFSSEKSNLGKEKYQKEVQFNKISKQKNVMIKFCPVNFSFFLDNNIDFAFGNKNLIIQDVCSTNLDQFLGFEFIPTLKHCLKIENLRNYLKKNQITRKNFRKIKKIGIRLV